ncbi:hypothetical protein HPB48_007591 [Haemaphysalis longicornis]|uniref:Uncharacterized protein n=1 Tax=Haemaphysalis longicornis TaxID=44386 RepID=A0A9J6FQG0_HAELO|nr:hypothetical protein HPB48_007591 [Haemaphysalis longicornis]
MKEEGPATLATVRTSDGVSIPGSKCMLTLCRRFFVALIKSYMSKPRRGHFHIPGVSIVSLQAIVTSAGPQDPTIARPHHRGGAATSLRDEYCAFISRNMDADNSVMVPETASFYNLENTKKSSFRFSARQHQDRPQNQPRPPSAKPDRPCGHPARLGSAEEKLQNHFPLHLHCRDLHHELMRARDLVHASLLTDILPTATTTLRIIKQEALPLNRRLFSLASICFCISPCADRRQERWVCRFFDNPRTQRPYRFHAISWAMNEVVAASPATPGTSGYGSVPASQERLPVCGRYFAARFNHRESEPRGGDLHIPEVSTKSLQAIVTYMQYRAYADNRRQCARPHHCGGAVTGREPLGQVLRVYTAQHGRQSILHVHGNHQLYTTRRALSNLQLLCASCFDNIELACAYNHGFPLLSLTNLADILLGSVELKVLRKDVVSKGPAGFGSRLITKSEGSALARCCRT